MFQGISTSGLYYYLSKYEEDLLRAYPKMPPDLYVINTHAKCNIAI